MDYAVVKIAGKQYRVHPGQILDVDRLDTDKKKLSFDQVLLIRTDKSVKLGKPYLSGASVTAELVEHLKGEKIRVATFKAKSRYRRVKGHRSHLTRVKIARILAREK